MFIKIFKPKAQSTAEYAILIGLVVGALLAMQVYVKRGLQAKIKQTTDNLAAEQYEPYYLSSDMSTTRQTLESENLEMAGRVSRGLTDSITRTGNQTYSSQPSSQSGE